MFHIEEVLQVKDTEDVKLVVRKHPVAIVPGLAVALLLIVIPFFFLFPLFSWGVPGVSTFALSIFGGVVVAVRTIVLWNADVLILTTLRVVQVDQRGMFSRFVTEIPLPTIQDVSWRSEGVVDTVMKAGTLSVRSMGTSPDVEMRRVGHPERIHELLNDLRNRTAPRRTDVPPDVHERMKRLMVEVEDLPDEAKSRVEAFVKTLGRSEAVASFLGEPTGSGRTEDASEGTLAVESRRVADTPSGDDGPPHMPSEPTA
ncbi:PH domain-containing protein [Candidatus Uhrbacteria bacterium]|nr:PH domain-containing protein [Candidatus Uhrbacteria bacterium]